MDTKDPHIKRQDAVYRRGLVLGLTMAEIMILILFSLLLAFTAAIATREEKIFERDKRITELVAVEKEIQKILENSPPGVTVEDIIRQIAREKKANAALREELDRLKPYEERAKALEHIIRELQLENIIRELRRDGIANPTPKDIAQKLRELLQIQEEALNLKGQIAQMRRQIRQFGRGNEFPSCWVTPDGGKESIFEVLIKPGGIVVHDRGLPHRASDKAALPLESVQYETELLLEDFQRQLRPLYLWSVEQKCRFYVIIFSSDASVRTDLVNAVNSFFYPDSRIQVRQ